MTHPVLGSLTIGYAPIVDAQRSLAGLRLTLVPQRPDAPVDGAALKEALVAAWPQAASDSADSIRLKLQPTPTGGVAGAKAGPGAAVMKGTVLLTATGEPLLRALLDAQPLAPFALEVPAFMLESADVATAAAAYAENGGTLWLQGRPESAGKAAAMFRHVIYDAAEAPPAARGTMGAVASGVRRRTEADRAQQQGAVATVGWPVDEPAAPPNPSKKPSQETQVVLDLIRRVEKEEPVEKLELALKGDPTLAFRLLRYMNSAAFGLTVEISSFRHALMMLGYQKLKRWLALLLASASKNPAMKPVMACAVRRGMLMEELARGSGDAELRGEMFICGVFSLLDVMLEQPFSELLKSVPVPERVALALGEGTGPFGPYLDLVRALERSDTYEAQEHAAAVMLAPAEVNRAVLAALVAAESLD
ncbi:MAG: HDOD domain-containing protein [Rubrivivax sp.]|jgi:EAL and modified HD-GYP domain-containing signal transduction protein|nr:HDOD domain-containing protein [Rubrivivax sp.]